MELLYWFAGGFIVSSFWTYVVYRFAYVKGYRHGAERVLNNWKNTLYNDIEDGEDLTNG